VSFTNAESNTVVECAYDHMGRRATKKVTVDGAITLHQRYLYRGYLQIACCDLTRSNHPCLWLITWDPTQPIATRPLAIQKDATWYTYGWDLTKNICELYGTNGYIRTAYTYTPYGEVTESTNSVYQPIQWSSEFNDTELVLVYYNYRHYNPLDGRWLGRDRKLYNNLYQYINNSAILLVDILGLKYILNSTPEILEVPKWALDSLGKFVILREKKDIPGVDFKTYPCSSKVVVPDIDITGIVKLVSDDEEYITTLFHLIENEQNIYLSIEDAKEYVRKHEMNHFRHYRSRMSPYVSFANSLDGKIVCRTNKLKKYLDAYLFYALAQHYADGAELDVKDYYGLAKINALKIRAKRYADLYQKYLTYMEAYEEYYN